MAGRFLSASWPGKSAKTRFALLPGHDGSGGSFRIITPRVIADP